MNTKTNNLKTPTKPALKWAGGKTQLLSTLKEKFPDDYSGRYIDPFMGALAVPLNIMPNKAVLSDANEELVITHITIRDEVESVIEHLSRHKDDRDYFNKLRAKSCKDLSNSELAARMIYLNKSCFNGLYRLNKKGQFNSPYGKPTARGRNLCNPENLKSVSKALKGYKILHQDFRKTLRTAKANDLVFLDPPYHGTFTAYTSTGFSDDDQKDLAVEFQRLTKLGCHVIATNSNHEFVHELFSDYEIEIVNVRRSINRNGNDRKGKEVIISNQNKIPANDDIVLKVVV